MILIGFLALVGLLVHDYLQWRIAGWQAHETARLVRLAVFGPDGPAPEDQSAVREALVSPDVVIMDAFPELDVTALDSAAESLGRSTSPAQTTDSRHHDLTSRSRSATWTDPPQGSARARRGRPAGG